MLVHGDSNEMGKLKAALNQIYKDRIQILCPRNCQKVRFNLVSKKSAKIVGTLAKQIISEASKFRDQLVLEAQTSQQAQLTQMPPAGDAKNQDVEMRDCDDTFIKIDGIMVKQDFDMTIMAVNEVSKFTQLQSFNMRQSLHVEFQHDI